MNRPADIVGTFGSAWEMTSQRERYEEAYKPDWDAGVVQWLIHGSPAQFLGWDWWLVGVIHLRDIPGVPPAFRKYPDAQYEFAIRSLDARGPEGIQVDSLYPFARKVLQPDTYVRQFDLGHVRTLAERDALARELGRKCMLAICDGILPPELHTVVDGKLYEIADARANWDSSIDKTIEHFLTGGHMHFADDMQHRKGAVH